MKCLIVDNGTKHLSELVGLVRSVGMESEVVEIGELNLDSVNDFDMVILSGGGEGKAVVRHPEIYEAEIELVKSNEVSVLGICLGSEIGAYAYNSRLRDRGWKRRGKVVVEVFQQAQDEWFLGAREFVVYEAHRWVIEEVGRELEVLAISEDGVEVWRHKTKPVFGLQFHPEVMVDRLWGDEVFKGIIENLKLKMKKEKRKM